MQHSFSSPYNVRVQYQHLGLVIMESNERILVVDDHYEIRDLLGQYLTRHSMQVTSTMTGTFGCIQSSWSGRNG